jgi:predicted PP-loop superfamily ATPase
VKEKIDVMKNITSLVVGLFLSLSVYAQQKLDYDTDSRWFWGLNVGSTWSKADVAKKNDWGFGLTIGKAFNYNYGRKLSFDIRGRYLTGEWYGQNYDTTDISGIYPYNLPGTDYSSTLGYSVLNHKTRVHELSLELVIHANNLRARTGWDPYVFGGIGYSWYKATGNLLGSDDNIIQYDQLVAANDISKESITDVFGALPDYETNLINDPAHEFARNWMPSLGLGLGYQFGKRFSMGIEHKTTFTRADNFDGYILPTGKYANDWYHYTSLYMTFQLRAQPIAEPERQPIVVDQTTPTVKYPPIVDYRNPMNDVTVNSPNYNLVVSVANVLEQQQVQLTQNGKPIYFNWNRNSGTASATVTLQLGANVFTTVGTNQVGTDQETITIIYERLPEPPTPPVVVKVPPVVTITNPAVNPKEVTTPTYAFESTVLNVTQQNQITVKLNGQNIPFVFNPTTHQVTGNLLLIQGANTLQVAATNADGSDSKQTVLIYRPVVVKVPPVVTITNPAVNPKEVTTPTYAFESTVLNVTQQNQITVKLNGQNIPFVFNPTTHQVTGNLLLIQGANTLQVAATNADGSDSKQTVLIYRPVVVKVPPVVTITNPSVNPKEVTSATFAFESTVLNVTQKNQITVQLNGQNTPFGFNPATHQVTGNLTLIQGANTLQVAATNADGSDSKQTVLIYKPAPVVLLPEVNFVQPQSPGQVVAVANYNMLATVLHVTAANQITVSLNGQQMPSSAWLFNANSHTVSMNTVLATGNNVFVVTGTNAAGTANATTTIIFRQPVVECIKPSITFMQPTALLTGGTVNQSTITMTAQVTEVVSVTAISCRLNGVLQAAGTYTAGTYSKPLDLVSGQNVIELSATNNCGTTTTSKTIVYRAPQVEKPVITLKSPTSCPALLARGPQVITGTVSGVANASQVTISYNNSPVVFTSTIANNTLTFSCTVTVLANTLNFPLVITATNQGGVTVKECLISIKDYAGGGNDQTSPVGGDKPKPSPAKPRTPINPTDTIRKPIITPPTTPAQP